MPFLSRYFTWLKKNAPEGQVEVYPIVSDDFSTNIPGIFVVGDLTGVPLLKFASHSGAKIWDSISQTKNDLLDAVIIGAGPSGVACALEAEKLEKKIVLLEAGKSFQTIHSYPKGKPIFAEPKDFQIRSALPIFDGTKESLLDHLHSVLRSHSLPLLEGERVNAVTRNTVGFTVRTESGKEFHSNHVIIAMGKSGDPRRLGVPGEDLPHVSYRLIDPKDYSHKKVVIVGGGDSAVEAAIAVSEFAESVTLVHRGSELTRPKEDNIKKLGSLLKHGKINLLKESNVREIQKSNVISASPSGAKKIPTDEVLLLLGTTPPIPFLKKLGIQIQSSKSFRDWVGLVSVFTFAIAAYFGKASFYASGWFSPFASASAGIFVLSSFIWLFLWTKANGVRFPSGWKLFRNLYLIFASVYFLFVYFSATYGGYLLFEKYPGFHYTFLYSLTILVFGIRRISVKPTQYIKLQTFSLISVQWFFLFLLPEIILPFLGKAGYLGAKDGFLLTQVFPAEAYWKAYGFILAWPLSMGVLYDGGITDFWLIYGLVFSFGVIPLLVYHYGKGAYCGWICSCGGLAETLGDEHREKMPHGKWAYRLEHSGQWILLIAFILTILKLVGVYGKSVVPDLVNAEYAADSIKWIYDLVVDIGLAGVIGVGFYFFYSGRIWCRMFCPLAGLMHIYARFSKFRIFSEKKKCISCNICTKVCHQGIDVMSYANIGRPMDSVQCVRCSACVSSCPTQVLSFGKQGSSDFSFDTLKAII
ncbi:NAD(P)-binding domain-containing protein [Leptospira sp. 'Mane']|uniref:NAD(P)-binding domain-containing protein n=1 Tax=Leptospira sp. 'Mane' TaxID=3387407 RepID=UPI00398AD438